MKNLMKRLISILVVISLCASFLCVTAGAAEITLGWTPDVTTLDAEQESPLAINVTNVAKAPLFSFRFYVYCDTTAIKLTEATENEDGDIVGGALFTNAYGGSGVVTPIAEIPAESYDGAEGKDGYLILGTRTGTTNTTAEKMGALNFAAVKGAYNGQYTIELDLVEAVYINDVGTEADVEGVNNPEPIVVEITNGTPVQDLPAISVSNLIYTGEDQTVTATISGPTAEQYEWSADSVFTAKNVGSYTISATGKKGYTGTSTATWQITPATIETNAAPAMTIYKNDNEYAIGADVLGISTVKNCDATVTYTVKSGPVTIVDGNKLKATATGNAVVTALIEAANHNDKTVDIAVTIASKMDVSGDVAFTSKKTEETYTGSGMQLSDFVNAATYNGAESDKITYKLNGEAATLNDTITDAGTYTVTATYEDAENMGQKEIVITIKQAEISVSALAWNYTGEFTYDKNEKSVALTDVDSKLDIAYENAAKTDAGEYTASATATVKEEYAKNYKVVGEIASCDWKIAPKPVTIGELEYDNEFTFDNKEYNVTLKAIPEGAKAAYAGDLNRINVGDYTTVATLSALNGNYTVSGELEQTMNWKIVKKALALAEKFYSPASQSVLANPGTVTVEVVSYDADIFESVKAEGEKVIYNLKSGLAANQSAEIKINVKSDNYTDDEMVLTVNLIEKKPITGEIKLPTKKEATYNGSAVEYAASYEQTGETGWTYTYVFEYIDGGETKVVDAMVDAGTYKVTVTVQNDRDGSDSRGCIATILPE